MKYNVNLFGMSIETQLRITEENNVVLCMNNEEQKRFKKYLIRVLTKYIDFSPTGNESFEVLLKKALEIEQTMGRMNEPTLKLPYEVTPDIKDKLVKAAELQDTSATQLLIRLIEHKYENIIG